MAVSGILLLGRPSTGKTTSLRNLDPKTTVLFTPNTKPLSWRGGSTQYKDGDNRFVTSSLVTLKLLLEKLPEKKPNTKIAVIEDFSHLLSSRTMDPSFNNSTNWSKWGGYASDVHAIIKEATEKLDKLEAVILVHHTAIDENGVETFLSSGKLLDQQIRPVSFFTYVLHSVVREGELGKREYLFQTNFADNKEAKTPMGLYDQLYVPNDISEVIKTIKDYESYQEPENS